MENSEPPYQISAVAVSTLCMDDLAERDAFGVRSLDSTFSRDAVSMDLTMCGLLVDQAEQMSRLYAKHRDWTAVEEQWFEQRIDERSTRGSSRKIYSVLSSRFKAVDRSLPSIAQLPSIFDQCETYRAKAQVLYFYLIEDDPLVKYVVHAYVHRLLRRGADGLEFDQDTVDAILQEFHYSDGTEIEYAESTTGRWGSGFRSVMRNIGVLETEQAIQGRPPNISIVPLLVSSGYSYEQHGREWLSTPTGWLYLFQLEEYWSSLAERLAEHDAWESSGIHGELRLEPVGDTYAWAEARESDA